MTPRITLATTARVFSELRRDPLRVEVGAVGMVESHWTK